MQIDALQPAPDAPSPPAGDGALAELRALVGVELPPLFVRFLQAVNGRSIEQYGFKLDGFEGTFQCPIVYSLHAGFGAHSLIAELRDAREHNGVPPEVIPFACRLNGRADGVMYLDLTASGGGRVMAWLAARPAWTGRNPESGWFVVAPSFEAYVEMLFESA